MLVINSRGSYMIVLVCLIQAAVDFFPELVYGSAEGFLHEQLLPTYVRDVDGRAAKWCIEWYYHAEAVSRAKALWRAWEHLR